MGNNLSAKKKSESRVGRSWDFTMVRNGATGKVPQEQSPEMRIPRAGTHSSSGYLLARAFVKQPHGELMSAERISCAKQFRV